MKIHFIRIISRISPVFVFLFLFSCGSSGDQGQPFSAVPASRDSIIAFNQQIVTSEKQEIEDYIERYRWHMQVTETGLRYMLYQPGTGVLLPPGSLAVIKYSVNLLNGDLVFKTPPDSLFTFEIGKRKVISGLEEGIMMMNKGSKAKLIIPSHLALGLLGDMSKVPTRAVLVCDVELCSFQPIKK